jgi:ABC-2 type transport system permease protein
MHRVLAIAKREYLTRIRSRSFQVGTLLTPLAMVLWVSAPAYFASKSSGVRDVTVLDQSGDPEMFAALEQRLQGTARDARAEVGGRPLGALFKLEHVPVAPGADLDAERRSRELRRSARERAVLVLRSGVLEGTTTPEYYGITLSDPAINDFGRAVGGAITQRQLARTGVDSGTISRVIEVPRMQRQRLSTAGGVTGESAEDAALVMLITMYLVTFLYGMWVMRGVSADKRSRVVEVLLTVAKPVEIMAGKLIGIGGVGLTQCALWVGGATLLSLQGVALAALLGFDMPRISATMLGYFAVYFILGYFVFATLYALAGAASTSADEQAQQVQLPLTMLAVVPIMVFFVILRDPNGTASVVLSLVPFFAPTLMVLRLAISDPPTSQVVLSIVLMVLTIAVSLWATAKVFRAGILMSGKRMTLPELVRWLRYA